MEIWASIPEYSGLYEVSNLGRVRSVERTIVQTSRAGKAYQRTMKSKMLSLVPGSDGRYLYVHLANREKAHHSVHSLVLRAFVGEPTQDQEGCHNDGDSCNNVLSNLRWGTHASNEEDRKLHGTVLKGELHPCSLLTEQEVRQIKLAVSTYSGRKYGRYAAIAKQFGVDPKTVGELHRGTRWAHIT